MGKRTRRRARKQRNQGAPPENFIRGIEYGASAMEELRSGATPEHAVAERRSALRSVIDPMDAIHVLGQVAMAEVALDADTYKESDHPGSAFVIEMVAAEIIRRPTRAGTRDSTPVIDGRVLGEVRRLAHEAAMLESFRRFASSGGFESPEGAARGRAATQHLMLRGPGWPWQEHETLRGLFGPSRFSEQIVAALGFGVEDAITCSDAVVKLIPERVRDHMLAARATAGEFGTDHPAYRWATENVGGWQDAPAQQQAHGITALWAMNHIGDALLLDAEALAESAGVEVSAATAYLTNLGQTLGQEDGDWFQMAEAVRYRPFIEFDEGRYLLTVPGNNLWALRSRFESALKADKAYTVHRGRWLERRAVDLLAPALCADEAHVSVDFSVPSGTGQRAEGEIDGLIRCGDVGLVIEAKSATMRAGARRGGEALLRHLRDTLAKAAAQGTHARDAFEHEGQFRVNGRALELGERIREVHPILVTLDDLSPVAPVLWQLEGSRVMPEGVALPWVVTLHELELVAQTIEWPAQFVHFLRRRARLNALGRHIASDELDWWMHYLLFGLYFDVDEDVGPIRFTSLTDSLDAWVLYERGLRETPAPRPTMKLDDSSRRFMDLICSERPDGWVPAACAFLEVSGEARKRLWRDVKRLRRRAPERMKVQRGTFEFTEAREPMVLCFLVVPDEDRERVLDYLGHLVSKRLDELGEHIVLGLGVGASSKRPYDALVVVDRAWRSS